ncbi:EGFR-like transmembrane domain-containing protein [Aspergillus affinis]|uniref:EGFR-like transmembrane domain-containing protein n=1 Tax=Aspergillus affinis TaxID=1070780 RepID=UPI0022FE6132|nr:uncharacterized protein KD926_004299 [Aspergillus affinis]KAI9035195.1 hypothetical protein KD926_004299 [Aspergillus affinis]
MEPLLALLFLHTATTSAWTFTWRNASSSSFLKNSHDPIPCTNIDQAKGQQFDFHPENDNFNFYIWATENCTGDYAGYTTPDVWRKKASKDMHSYLVDYGDESGPKSTALATASTATTGTSTSSTSTASSTASSTGSATSLTGTGTAAASTSASSDANNGPAISGGAIAGIVIAVVAGLSILGAGFFYLGRRARRGNTNLPGSSLSQPPPPSSSQPQNMYPSPSSIPPSSSHGRSGGAEISFGAEAQYPQAHGPTKQMDLSGTQKAWVELPGEDMAAELSVSRQVNELDGHSKMMYQ